MRPLVAIRPWGPAAFPRTSLSPSPTDAAMHTSQPPTQAPSTPRFTEEGGAQAGLLLYSRLVEDVRELKGDIKEIKAEFKVEMQAVREELGKIDKQISSFWAVLGVLGVLGTGTLGVVWLLVQSLFQNIDKVAEVFIRVYGK